jgi:hypothetical protein
LDVAESGEESYRRRSRRGFHVQEVCRSAS